MDKLFLSRIDDLIAQCEKKNTALSTAFLDPVQRASALAYARKLCCCESFGGYEGAERAKLLLSSYPLEKDSIEDAAQIASLKIDCKFGEVSHRDYLGSLLGLGIKRECIGDILVFEGYAYLFLDFKITPFVEENLERVGKYGAEVSKIALSEVELPPDKSTAITCTVASLRADTVAAAAFSTSRGRISEKISEGALAINWIQTQNPAAAVHEGDMLSMRGTGRAKISEIRGVSKKGRVIIEILRYNG